MKAIKRHGGRTIVQDESSLIFSMPKAVIDAGLTDKVVPAGEIAGAIARSVYYKQEEKKDNGPENHN
jgi:two-component system chemotaxis response regulator CheB